jgi:hypothetical protein
MAPHRAATPPTAPPTITSRTLEGLWAEAGNPVDGETEVVDVALCDDAGLDGMDEMGRCESA